MEDLDENDKIILGAISSPDLSCNWCKFSEPKDVLFTFRRNAKQNDGCYSFTVEASRYENMATPVHDPVLGDDKICPNYAHVEVRALREGEDVLSEPPKKSRKLKPNSKKLEYRQNLRKCLKIEFMAA